MTTFMTDGLEGIAERLIRELRVLDAAIEEGLVRTIGPPSYRRLDVQNRALAYVRVRPKRGWVRVDVPSIWPRPSTCRLALSSSNGWALALRKDEDVQEAVQAVLTSLREARTRSGAGRGM